MKLSNKLLIGFAGAIFLYLSAAFIELRVKGDHDDLDSSDAITESLPIENVRYINIDDLDTRISITSSNEPRIEIRSMSGGLIKSLEYQIYGDTLEITGMEETGSRRTFTLFVPNEIVGLRVFNTRVFVSNLDLNEIKIEAISASVSLDNNVNVNKLSIVGSRNSNFNARESQVDSLTVDLNRSNAFLYTEIKGIEGAVSKSSRLIISGAGEINIKKDASSNITWMEDVDAVIRVENN